MCELWAHVAVDRAVMLPPDACTQLGIRLGGCVPGRLREALATTAGWGGLATGAGSGWLSRASISWDWLG